MFSFDTCDCIYLMTYDEIWKPYTLLSYYSNYAFIYKQSILIYNNWIGMIGQNQVQSSEESQQHQQKQFKKQSVRWCSENRIYQFVLFILFLFFTYTVFSRIQYQYSYNYSVSPRVNLEQPKNQQHQLKVWKIINHYNANTNQNCVLMNAANTLTQLTLKSIKSILQQQQIGVMYVVIDKRDIKGNFLIQNNIKNEKNLLLLNFDSDYTFFKSIKNECLKLGYLFGNFEVDSQMANNLRQQFKQLDSSSLYFASMYRGASTNRAQPLKDLSVTDLSKKKPEEFYQYLYILNTEFFHLISPLNFVFYSKYTLEQMILIPSLVIYQSLGKLITSKRILYTLQKKYQFMKFKQFKLEEPKKKSNSLCFISYPNDPFLINETQLQSYMSSINRQSKIIGLSVVIYFPYKFNYTTQLYRVAAYLKSIGDGNKELNIRIRICNQKAVSSYAVYDSVYNYCPLSSLIVSSRHNIVFKQEMASQVLESVTEKYHYYFIDLEFQNRTILSFNSYFYENFYMVQKKLKWNIFEQKAHYVQIFKSDLMKTGAFWILKSAQVDFYETQEVFFIHMMQLIRNQYGYIDNALVKVTPRKFTEVQLRQIKAIKTYSQYVALIFNYLMPYLHNCLENPVYRRNSPMKMPANIHQIWISNNPISEIRYKLRQTLIKKNPNFNVYLWTMKNITKASAPFTFDLVQRVLMRHKQHQKSLYAMAADILRYELLVSYGGIYIDFKFEGLKPLDNFLKYEVIFTDCDINNFRLGIPKAVGNPIMASTQNNYHLKIMLTQLIREQEFQFGVFFSIPQVTGAFLLRQSITYKELFTQVGFGYHLFIPESYQPIVNLCGGTEKEFDKDQEVFEVDYVESDLPIKLGIPCKEYPEAYILDYSPLGRTWVFKKAK